MNDDSAPVQVPTYFEQCGFSILHHPEFLFLVLTDFAEQLQDDPRIFDYNVEQRVNDFVDAARTQVSLNFRVFDVWVKSTLDLFY